MPPTQVDRDSFLRHLRSSGLLTNREFRKVTDAARATSKPRTIARKLVELGVLTKFQAELLLVGRSNGFFLGPYKILDQLGQGGMGRVYKALHQTMNRVVALKVLAPHLVKTPKAQKLFQREVQSAARLNHPNIVTAYDANQINGRHYLAMEFVDGPNLEQLVREQGPLPVGMACEIIRQAANGLEAAHEQAMVHRDIKPGNLLLQPSKNLQSFVVKILDFGLAHLHETGVEREGGPDGPPLTPGPSPQKAEGSKKREQIVMGTPDFLSPEQARNLETIDVRSDLYSLGCTFYFLLTGKVPFAGGTTLEKLLRHSSENPIPLDAFRRDVPEGVEDILKKMMAKKPGDRFQSPLELAEAIAPHAVVCAPPWDEQARQARQESLAASQEEVEITDVDGPNAMVGTVPPALAPTPLTPSDDNLALPWSEPDPADHRVHRNSFVWALVIVGSLMATLAGLLVYLAQ